MKTHYFKHNATLLGICLFIVTTCGCTKESLQKQLPPITQTGANTFGAIVDGRVFVPKDSYSSTPGGGRVKALEVLVGHDFFDTNGNDKWFISTYNYKDSPETYIYIYIPTLLNNPMNHLIQESDGSEKSNLSYPHIYCLIKKGQYQYRSYNNSGELNFSRLDMINGIYSGTFNVKLKNKDDSTDIIEITDGRFDINLNTINN